MNYVLNEKINLSHESIYNINTFRIYMIKILFIWYIIMYSVYSYVHSLPLIITLNICEILRNNWIHLLKKNKMLPGLMWYILYHKFAFFNELMHRIKKKILKSAQLLLLLNKLRTNTAKFEEKKAKFLDFWKNRYFNENSSNT